MSCLDHSEVFAKEVDSRRGHVLYLPNQIRDQVNIRPIRLKHRLEGADEDQHSLIGVMLEDFHVVHHLCKIPALGLYKILVLNPKVIRLEVCTFQDEVLNEFIVVLRVYLWEDLVHASL